MISILCSEGDHQNAHPQWPKAPLCKGKMLIAHQIYEDDDGIKQRAIPRAEQAPCTCECHSTLDLAHEAGS